LTSRSVRHTVAVVDERCDMTDTEDRKSFDARTTGESASPSAR
jgi:hypothetical protein